MRHIGLLAFGTTVGILVPAATLHLTAGPEQRAKLIAAGDESLDLNGTHVAVSMDRRVVDTGESVKLKLVADKKVTVGVVVFGSSGTEGWRVPSPPVAVAHREITLQPDWTGHASKELGIKLTGANVRSGYNPFGTYTFYVMSPKAADRLADVHSRAGQPIPTGEIPDVGPGEELLWHVQGLADSAADKSPDRNMGDTAADDEEKAKTRDERLFTRGTVARIEAYTRPNDKSVALALPETTTVGKPFDVAIAITNPTKSAQHLKLTLAFPPIGSNSLEIKAEAIKSDTKELAFDIAKGETKRFTMPVTALAEGVLGVQARVECEQREDDDEDSKTLAKHQAELDRCRTQLSAGMSIGTFDAIEIKAREKEAPKTVAVTWP
jgi:hypothetical protein